MAGSSVDPIIKAPGQPTRTLRRLDRGHRAFNERFLQDLLVEHPDLLPVRQLRPDAGDLICVGREVRVASGPIDNLFLSTQGYPVVVETKLWRNPQSRREVLSQTLDYVKEIVRKDFEWLSQQFDAFHRRTTPPQSLLELVATRTGTEESAFVDRVNNALRRGDVIALIVGDGIETGLQELVSHLCRDSTHLRYSLALVELACYELGSKDDGFLIVPKIIQEIEPVQRAYVRIDLAESLNEKIVVTPQAEATQESPDRKRRPSLTEEDFWEKVGEQTSVAVRNEIRSVCDDFVDSLGLVPDFKSDSLLLKASIRDGEDAVIALLGIRSNGGFFNPRTMSPSLANCGFDPETVGRLVSEYWTALNRIDSRFQRDGVRVLDPKKFIPFNELKNKASQLKLEISNAAARIQAAADVIAQE